MQEEASGSAPAAGVDAVAAAALELADVLLGAGLMGEQEGEAVLSFCTACAEALVVLMEAAGES